MRVQLDYIADKLTTAGKSDNASEDCMFVWMYERERETDRETERQTDRQTETEGQRDRERETERERDRQTESACL